MRTTWLLGCLVIAACGGGGSDAPDGGGGDGPQPGVDSGLLPPTDLELLRAFVAEAPTAADPDALREALIDRIQAGDHGWPVRDEGVLGVIAVGAGPFAVSGDFNAWSTTANPLEPVAGDFDVPTWVAIVPDVPAGEPAGYKLFASGLTYQADPVARRYTYDENGELSLIESSAAHLERYLGFDGGTTLEPRTIRVLVPAPPADPATRYPVIYAHDGQNLFDPNAAFGGWHVQDAAAGAAPCFIVGVDNTPARMDEYTHVQDVVGGGTVGGRADEYLRLLDGVRDLVGQHYLVGVGPANAAIMGSSLGGLVSLYAAQQQPDAYGTAISLSGTVGWGTFGASNATVGELIAADPPTGVTIYVDSGGAAPDGCELRDDSDNYCDNVALADRLRGLGWVDEDTLFYRHQAGAAHNEAAWAARLPVILTTVFPGPR